MSNDLDLHGWTAVPRSFSTLLEGKPHLHPPRPDTVPSLGFPTTDPLVVRIHDHAKAQLRKETYNHSMRVYYFGTSPLPPFLPFAALAQLRYIRSRGNSISGTQRSPSSAPSSRT